MTDTRAAGRWWGFVALTLGVSIIIADATVMNVANPASTVSRWLALPTSHTLGR